jgi:Ran GTPase-activating protein (RanGAP) involved in mRNA processing and transport
MSNTTDDNSFLFLQVLASIPVEDLCKALSYMQIFSLRKLSKKVKELVDNMRLCINAKLNLLETLRTTKNKLIIRNSIKSLQNINRFHSIITLTLTGCDYFMDFMLPLILEIKTLEHLYLNSNNFGYNYCCTASAQEFFNVLKNINLKTLVFIGNDISQKDIETLVLPTSLTSLNLSYNNIGDEVVEKLAKLKVFQHLSSLKELNISNNCIRVEGSYMLAKAIKSTSLTSLTSLNLSHNYFENSGSLILAKAIASTSTFASLTSLDLSCNFNEENKYILSKILEKNTALTCLKL